MTETQHDIEDLRLAPTARRAALALRSACPDARFTSGRRGVEDQARAMASNVVKNRKWIVQTYANAAAAGELQAWVDANPGVQTRDGLAFGLERIMRGWTDAQRGRLSRHFSGEAFDVQPVAGKRGAEIKAAIRALPGLQKFLEKEGGLIRWHAQFPER